MGIKGIGVYLIQDTHSKDLKKLLIKIINTILIIMLCPTISSGQKKTVKKNQLDSITPLIKQPKNYHKDTNTYFTIKDTNFSKYSLPDIFTKPKNWIKVEESRNGELGEWYGNTYSDSFNLQDALNTIDNEKELSKICSAKSWCLKNYKQAFPYLVVRLSNKKKIGLINTADLIIGDRIYTGDLKFYGHGGTVDEDIFTIAGRASWILNEITGEDFAVVHANLTKEDAEKFKVLWRDYLNTLK